MIEFITLFLGLVSGPQAVAVSAADDVAKVELRLDREVVAQLEGPHWSASIDFGQRLLPRELSATSYDSSGRPLRTITQFINVPRGQAEASLVVQLNDANEAVAQLLWETALGEEPSSLTVQLDGEPLTFEDATRIELPSVDPRKSALLEANLRFPSGATASAQLLIGGATLEEVRTDLTALPLRWRTRVRKRPQLIERWLVSDVRSVDVVATEQSSATLMIIKGPGVLEAVRKLPTPYDRDHNVTSERPMRASTVLNPKVALSANRRASDQSRWTALPFKERQTIVLSRPFARRASGRNMEFELFASSEPIADPRGGLLWLLEADVAMPNLEPGLRLGDATAVAGLQAARWNRPRVVVALTTGESSDQGRYSVDEAATYLQALGVPFYLWQLGDGRAIPGAERISSYQDLVKSYAAVQRDLRRQQIAWLDGFWLPTDVQAREGSPFAVLASRSDNSRADTERP